MSLHLIRTIHATAAAGLMVIVLTAAGCTQPANEAPPPAAPAPPDPGSLAGVDTRELAAKLVLSAAVKEGDVVLVTGGVHDWPLLEDLAVEIRRRGAWAVTTPASEDLTRRLVDEVPARFDRQVPARDLALAGMADVTIAIEFVRSDVLLAHVQPERVAAQAEAFRPVTDVLFKRGVRQVALGNGLLPTPAAANRWGVSQDDLATLYWAGLNTDYEALQATASAVAAKLTAGKTIRITHPNGTDLTVGIDGRQGIPSDGVISPEDIAAGGGALSVYLPAGEAFIAPVPGTAEGKVVLDHLFFQGTDVQNLTLTFAQGRLTSMTAAAGLEPLQALYDASDAGKDELSAIDIGLNPDVQIPAGSMLRTWVPAGMVTIGIGNNLWASGANSSSFFIPAFLPGSTLQVDGAALVQDGRLVR
jgi:leucyl aminopeptidase (aminopeptidase T)